MSSRTKGAVKPQQRPSEIHTELKVPPLPAPEEITLVRFRSFCSGIEPSKAILHSVGAGKGPPHADPSLQHWFEMFPTPSAFLLILEEMFTFS